MIQGMRLGKVEKKIAFREAKREEKAPQRKVKFSPELISKKTTVPHRFHDSGCTLSDLCEEDKEKVSRLVQRIVDLEQETADLKNDIQAYQEQHDHIMSERTSLTSQLNDVLAENQELQEYRKESLLLLAQYQQHIQHLITAIDEAEEQLNQRHQQSTTVNEEISRLESVIASQRRTIEASGQQAQRIAHLEKSLEQATQQLQQQQLHHEDTLSTQMTTTEQLTTLQHSLSEAEQTIDQKDFMIKKLQEEIQVLHTVNKYLQRSSPDYMEFEYGSPIVLSKSNASHASSVDHDAVADIKAAPPTSVPSTLPVRVSASPSESGSQQDRKIISPSKNQRSHSNVAPEQPTNSPALTFTSSSTAASSPRVSSRSIPSAALPPDASHAARVLTSSIDSIAPPPPKTATSTPPRRLSQASRLSLSSDSLIVPTGSTTEQWSVASSIQQVEKVYSEKLVPTWRAYPEHNSSSKSKKMKHKTESPGLKVWRSVKSSYDNLYDDSLFDLVDEINSEV